MDIYSEFINLARLSVSGRKDDAVTLVRRAAKKLSSQRPELESQLRDILTQTGKSGLRRAQSAAWEPNSTESFLIERIPKIDYEPVWGDDNQSILDGIVAEHENADKLLSANMSPTRSLLLVGPPGIGKTLAAHWLATKLEKKLLVLNLASIMSSMLGKTGANLSNVMESVAHSDSILFLDEFDSIGKSRDDSSDIGELKRLVNVLLQSLDNWQGSGLLVAATNYPDSLDQAVWRRFDQVLEFQVPDAENQAIFIERKLKSLGYFIGDEVRTVLASTFEGESFSELERWIDARLRKSIVQNRDFETLIIEEVGPSLQDRPTKEKALIASKLIKAGISQREASDLLQISRDTIRKYSDKKQQG